MCMFICLNMCKYICVIGGFKGGICIAWQSNETQKHAGLGLPHGICLATLGTADKHQLHNPKIFRKRLVTLSVTGMLSFIMDITCAIIFIMLYSYDY